MNWYQLEVGTFASSYPTHELVLVSLGTLVSICPLSVQRTVHGISVYVPFEHAVSTYARLEVWSEAVRPWWLRGYNRTIMLPCPGKRSNATQDVSRSFSQKTKNFHRHDYLEIPCHTFFEGLDFFGWVSNLAAERMHFSVANNTRIPTTSWNGRRCAKLRDRTNARRACYKN